MKRMLFILVILALAVSACAAPAENAPNTITPNQGSNNVDANNAGGNTMPNDANNTDDPATTDDAPTDAGNTDAPPESTQPPTCYPDGEHPIAASIAEQYVEISSYDEVMGWFCNGALFDDILNALVTEELSGVEAEELLQMLATGYTWNQIWLELGIIEK